MLLYPMAAMVLYILLIGIFNFKIRLGNVRSGAVSFGYFKVLDVAAYRPPEFLVRVGRHYDNQFELPMLFLVTCLVAMHLGQGSPTMVGLAWIFLITRSLHTYFHLKNNDVRKRAAAFFSGWGVVAMMWVRMVLFS